MRYTPWLLLTLLSAPLATHAEVRELDGEELLDTYVEGISIGQEVTDSVFAADDEEARKNLADQLAARGERQAAVSVQNTEALLREKSVLSRVGEIADLETRDLAEDAVLLTGAGEVFRMDLQRVSEATGIPVPAVSNSVEAFRSNLLQLTPVTTGYQFEFNSRF